MELRKLKDETDAIEPVRAEPVLPTSRIVRTVTGQQAQIDPEGFDFSTLDDLKPYRDGEVLPEPVIKTNKKGITFLKKPGEPRFFMQGNELIKVYRGLNGKKRKLFWVCNPTKPLHKRIRKYLQKKGIPGA
jgi:hypothetical protein